MHVLSFADAKDPLDLYAGTCFVRQSRNARYPHKYFFLTTQWLLSYMTPLLYRAVDCSYTDNLNTTEPRPPPAFGKLAPSTGPRVGYLAKKMPGCITMHTALSRIPRGLIPILYTICVLTQSHKS